MKFILTNAGKEMESKLVAGSKPIITRIESGDTYSQNPESLQSVINKKQLLQVESIEVVDGKSCITFLLTNLELAAEYWIRQIGIYAKQDEESVEILYLIGQDVTGELVPAPADRIVEYIYKLNLAVDNAYDMSFIVNSTDFARKQQVLNLEKSKVSASGGDISNTVTTVEEPEAVSDEYPEISGKGSVKDVMGKLLRWVKSLKDDKVTAFGGDIAETKVTSLQASKDPYPIPAAGDTTKVMFGKTKKFFEDVKNWMTGVCLIGQIVNNCVTNNPKMPLSAAQGKVLMDLYTQLNSNLSSTAGKVPSVVFWPLEHLKSDWSGLQESRNEKPLNLYLCSAIESPSGSHVTVIYYKHVSGNYGTALFMSYAFERPIYAKMLNGIWSIPFYL